MTTYETEPDLPVSVWEFLAEAWVDSGLSQGQGHLSPTVLGGTVCWHKSFGQIKLQEADNPITKQKIGLMIH